MSSRKLYQLTNKEFEFVSFVDDRGQQITKPAYHVPMLSWPDGHWCLLGNLYMLELYDKGLSRKGGGGTLLTYATQISHLVRYCYRNRVEFINLSNRSFTLFMTSLAGERRVGSAVPKRSANSTISVGRTCLDFLACVARFYNDSSFIGTNGRIVAEERESEVRSETGGTTTITKYWHHNSFPDPEPYKRRLPISTETVRRLNAAVISASKTLHQRRRSYAILKVLEITGGRRYEVSALTCESLRAATQMAKPSLKMETVKHRGQRRHYRSIPISRHDLEYLVEFMEKSRAPVVSRTCGRSKDDGYLFINERTGRKITPNTVTKEMSKLASFAGIEEVACAHMFRHRYATKIFVAIIEQHDLKDVDEAWKLVMNTESIKLMLRELLGQTKLASVQPYLHLAMEEVSGFRAKLAIATASGAVESFRGTLTQLREELKGGGLSHLEAARRLDCLTEALERDLSDAVVDNAVPDPFLG